ncbi:hypothetical protein KAR91_17880 [Candidatus Pacearchaeota archaeon]|nr:hypothetical protein [Candidatus Pacearchaeota archaeon]
MTLIFNEIRTGSHFRDAFIVSAADRRVSKLDGSYDSTRKKLFDVPYLQATLSYFGLAALDFGRRRVYMTDWLRRFIRRTSDASSLEEFARRLHSDLDTFIPTSILRSNPSGFHLSGFDSESRPDFWFITNIGGMNRFQYTNLRGRYSEPESHFLGRDAVRHLNWNGGRAIRAGTSIYRNGDLRSHVVAWEKLDSITNELAQFPDFHIPTRLREYGEYVRFKFEILAYYYKHWASRQIIARPIDVIILTSQEKITV